MYELEIVKNSVTKNCIFFKSKNLGFIGKKPVGLSSFKKIFRTLKNYKHFYLLLSVQGKIILFSMLFKEEPI